MTAEERRRAFASAFIEQARSDWSVRGTLAEQTQVPACHQLHYLQMACEKLAKAYRLRDTNSEVGDLVSKHSSVVAPENTEYPWEKDGQVVAPCRYGFPTLELLRQPGGRSFLNLVDRALRDFERVSLP
jgi:hypothetical protein